MRHPRGEEITMWRRYLGRSCVILICLCITIVGCRNKKETTTSVHVLDDPDSIRVTACNLFPAELRRIEPHLDLVSSGCVRVTPGKKTVWLTLSLETWEKGKKNERSAGSFGMPVSETCEVSISIRSVTDSNRPQYRVIVAVIGEKTKGSSPFVIDAPKWIGNTETRASSMSLNAPLDLADEHSAGVWGWGLVRGNQPKVLLRSEPIEEIAGSVDWAVVLKMMRGQPPS